MATERCLIVEMSSLGRSIVAVICDRTIVDPLLEIYICMVCVALICMSATATVATRRTTGRRSVQWTWSRLSGVAAWCRVHSPYTAICNNNTRYIATYYTTTDTLCTLSLFLSCSFIDSNVSISLVFELCFKIISCINWRNQSFYRFFRRNSKM